MCLHEHLRRSARGEVSHRNLCFCCIKQCSRSAGRSVASHRAWQCNGNVFDDDFCWACLGYVSTLCKPEVGHLLIPFLHLTGPVVSGFLELKKDWRWAFYVLLWLAILTMVPMFTIPETLPSQVLVNKARRIRRAEVPGYENVQAPREAVGDSLSTIFKITLTRPWIILFDPVSSSFDYSACVLSWSLTCAA